MKTSITFILSLITLALLGSEPDVDYHVVNTILINGERLEIELNPLLDGLNLQKVTIEAKNIEEAQVSLIINGITLDKKIISNFKMDKYIFETSNNAIIFGHNLDTIEIEAKGALSIKHVILQAK